MTGFKSKREMAQEDDDIQNYKKRQEDDDIQNYKKRQEDDDIQDYKKPWVGLTEEDLKPICDRWGILYGGWTVDFAKDVEQALKEKNNG